MMAAFLVSITIGLREKVAVEPLEKILVDVKRTLALLTIFTLIQTFNCFAFGTAAAHSLVVDPKLHNQTSDYVMFCLSIIQWCLMVFCIWAIRIFIWWKTTPEYVICIIVTLWLLAIFFIVNLIVVLTVESKNITEVLALRKANYAICIVNGLCCAISSFMYVRYFHFIRGKLLIMQRTAMQTRATFAPFNSSHSDSMRTASFETGHSL